MNEEDIIDQTFDDEIDETDELDNDKPKKKRPGRPRKNPIRQPRPRHGVEVKPSDNRHFVEFLYDKPLIFKKLWQFFKLMAVDKIHIVFTKEYITMWCHDHHKTSHMRIRINCNEVNHYYCENELDIGLSCKNPELIMSTIDKSYNSILLLSANGSTQKNIQIVLKNDLDIDDTHKIELLGEYNITEDNDKFEDNDYTIKFRLPGRYFKKMISDIKSFSNQITIKQDSVDDPLMFEYVKDDKKIKSLHIVKNSETVRLKSTLKDDDTFRTSFKIDYVKPISSALLSEHIDIYADENKPLMFITHMDNGTVELKILTDIIDNREIEI
jgi:hypothetical protein